MLKLLLREECLLHGTVLRDLRKRPNFQPNDPVHRDGDGRRLDRFHDLSNVLPEYIVSQVKDA